MCLLKTWMLVVVLAVIAVSQAVAGEGVSSLYTKECGACHIAYPPRFLPQRSWTKIMDTLAIHFGENASLGEPARSQILAHLVGNSAETAGRRMSRKILSSIGSGETPLRITETPYFKEEHDEVRPEVFKRKSVVSPANCPACHTGAEKGDFDEDRVKIPKD
jgi:hypothetical protein